LSFTKKVVRIGGQSKSKLIEEYNLRNITRKYKQFKNINKVLRKVEDKLKTIIHNIKYFQMCSEFVSYNAGILELSLLKNGMPKQYHNFFKTTLDLLYWLFHDYDHFKVDPIVFITGVSNELINKVFHSEKLLQINKEVDDYDDDETKLYEPDYLDLEYNHKDIVIYSITLDDIKKACSDLLKENIKLESLSNLNINFFNQSEEAKFNFDVMENIHDYFLYMLNMADADIELPRSIKNLYSLNMRQRWSLYFHWVKRTKELFEPKIRNYEKKYTQIYKQFAELQELENVEIIKNMHVVALTTTGAAKHKIMLEGLESPIGMS